MYEEIILSGEYKGNEEDYDCIRIAIDKLTNASQEQFENIKKEKWYNRLFDMLTFSQKGKKRVAEEISNIAQAQQIFIELLLRLVSNDEKISDMVFGAMKDIERLTKQDLKLLERIKKLETASLGIKKDTNISTLNNKEKLILSGCLYKLSEACNPSNEQKMFHNQVIRFLGEDAQMDDPMRAMYDLNEDARKKILAICMQYLYLVDSSEQYIENAKEFIDEFDIGKRTINSLSGQINKIYKARGIEGFLLQFETDYEEIPPQFEIEFADSNVENAEQEPIVLENYYISETIHVKPGNMVRIANKIVHFNAYIICDGGELIFENCIINYNATDVCKIDMKDGKMSILYSYVVCREYRESFFIKADKGEFAAEATKFIGCSNFFKGGNITADIVDCEMIDCSQGFVDVNAWEGKACIMGCTFRTQNVCRNATLIHAGGDSSFMENIIIESEKSFPENEELGVCYFSASNGAALNCTVNASLRNRFAKFDCGYVGSCRFSNCHYAVRCNGVIEDSLFIKCKDVISTGSIEAKGCQFLECYDFIFDGHEGCEAIVEYCKFINIKIESNYINGIALSGSFGATMSQSYIKNCIFDGIIIGTGLSLISIGFETVYEDGKYAYIEDCIFRNCVTPKGGKIIEQYAELKKSFGRNKIVKAIDIRNCIGLDKVNQEGSVAQNYVIEEKNSEGEIIGSNPNYEVKIGFLDGYL